MIAWHQLGIPGRKELLPAYHASILVFAGDMIVKIYDGNGQGGNSVHDGGTLALLTYSAPRTLEQYKKDFLHFSSLQAVNPGDQGVPEFVRRLDIAASDYQFGQAAPYNFLGQAPGKNSNNLASGLIVAAGGIVPTPTGLAPGFENPLVIRPTI
jgi:hypothetical protein